MTDTPPAAPKEGRPDWYYRIELAPGEITHGRMRPTLALQRDVFDRIDLKGARVLDIGSQEGAGTVALKRAGADYVAAYDRLDLSERLNAVSRAYDAPMDYFGGLFFQDLRQAMIERGVDPVFDVVNFSGVLYHMMDPLAGLAIARSFLRENGLMIVETSVLNAQYFQVKFNHFGRYYPGSNYFQITSHTLDYWLRIMHMRIIDALWRGSDEVCRVIAVCQATDFPVIDDRDAWATKRFLLEDVKAYGLHYDTLKSERPGPGFEMFPHQRQLKVNLSQPLNTESIHLFNTLDQTERHKIDEARSELRLNQFR